MIRAVIIEDEEFAVDRLKMLLNQVDEEVEVVTTISTVKESVGWLRNNDIDLIFLDVNLADGIAFKIFEQIDIHTPIIFTTAYHEYALRAFEQFSIDYLLKPISKEQLEKSLLKLTSLKSTETTSSKHLKDIIQAINQKQKVRSFMITVGNKVKIIDLKDVAYFVAESKITFIYTNDSKRYPIDTSLKQLQLSLPENDFFRINRQSLINRQSIQELQYFSTTRLCVIVSPKPIEDMIVAREKISVFKSWLKGD